MMIEREPFVHTFPHLHVARYNPMAAGRSKLVKPWNIAFFDIARIAGSRSVIGRSLEDQALRYPSQRSLGKKCEKRPYQRWRYMFVKRDL